MNIKLIRELTVNLQKLLYEHNKIPLDTRMEKKYWPQIKKAEQFNEEENKIFAELQGIFREKFYNEAPQWAN